MEPAVVKWEEKSVTVKMDIPKVDISQEEIDQIADYLRARMEEELRRYLDHYFYEYL